MWGWATGLAVPAARRHTHRREGCPRGTRAPGVTSGWHAGGEGGSEARKWAGVQLCGNGRGLWLGCACNGLPSSDSSCTRPPPPRACVERTKTDCGHFRPGQAAAAAGQGAWRIGAPVRCLAAKALLWATCQPSQDRPELRDVQVACKRDDSRYRQKHTPNRSPSKGSPRAEALDGGVGERYCYYVRRAPLATAMPRGPSNWPGSVPQVPKVRTNPPSRLKTCPW